MNAYEKKTLENTDKNLPSLVLILVTIIGLAIRLTFFNIISGDMAGCLLPWYDIISSNGLYVQVGDYNLLYQFLIWVMAKLPLPPLYAYKALSCIGDLLLAGSAALLIRQISQKDKDWRGIWTYTVIWLYPTVFINSAAWGQCDSIYTAFAILGLYFLDKEQHNRAIIALGISFAFKLQAVFILPVYLFCYYRRRQFSIFRFGLVPVTMIAVTLPLLFWKRNPLDTFFIYLQQTTNYPSISLNYPSFWNILCLPDNIEQFVNVRFGVLLFTICVLAVLMLVWIQQSRKTTGTDLLLLAFILAYTCVLFLPAMHERYGYLYEMCAIIIAILIPQTIPLCVGLLVISLHIYGCYLFNVPVEYIRLSFANIGVYLAYIYVIFVNKRRTASTPELNIQS